MAYIYEWHSVEGRAEGSSAFADTPIGRIKVDEMNRGPRAGHSFLIRVRGEVKGRGYISMDVAKIAAETKVQSMLKARKKPEGPVEED